MNSIEEYIANNKKIFALPRIHSNLGKQRGVVGWSIHRLILHHVRSIIGATIRYPRELLLGGKHFTETWKIRRSQAHKRALLIGNGPSQGYLTIEKLNSFKAAGGDTICVNQWNANKRLSTHIPTWMVFSDPDTFVLDKRAHLVEYLENNPSIKLLAPLFISRQLRELKLRNELFLFIDTELSVCKNINPLLPRGYLSMTLYKGLAWAVYLGYFEIGIVGMDNDYPRNIYNDASNTLYNCEKHAGTQDYLDCISHLFKNVAARLDDLTLLFHHLDYFPKDSIVNLDPFSLVDAFKKLPLSDFLQENFEV